MRYRLAVWLHPILHRVQMLHFRWEKHRNRREERRREYLRRLWGWDD